MQPTLRVFLLLVLGAALLAIRPARADDLQALEAENARLRTRVEQLERENAELQGVVRAAEPPLPARVVERETEDGKPIWATEQARIDTTGAGRAAHWLWLERTPGSPEATLWIRTEFSGGIYRHSERLELRLDGAGHSLPIARYNATRITTGVGPRPQRRDHEIVSVTLTPPVLAALAQAATMGGRLGRMSFTVPPEALASLRALARKTV
jgi:hypothetical protein